MSVNNDLTNAPTVLLLALQYGGRTVIPLEWVQRDFFSHLTIQKFLQKILRGQIDLPVVRIESSQKSAKGIYISDLAAYIDRRRAAAVKECRQLCGTT